MATNRYVDTGIGSDLIGTGSLAAPYETVNKAISESAAGDFIYIRGGPESAPVEVDQKITVSGFTGPLTITMYNNEYAVFHGVSNQQIIISVINSSDITISNIWVEYGVSHTYNGKKWGLVTVESSSDTILYGLKIYKTITTATRWSATYKTAYTTDYNNSYRNLGILIKTGCTDTEVDSCEIYGVNKGIQHNGVSYRSWVHDSNIHDTVQSGLDMISGGGVESGHLFEDNTVEGSFMEDGFQSHPLVAGAIENVGVILRGNIFRDCGENAIDLKGARRFVIENNIMYGIWGSNNGFHDTLGNNRNSLVTLIKGALATENTDGHIIRHNISYDNAGGFNLWPKTVAYNNTLIWHQRDYLGSGSTYNSSSIPAFFGFRYQDSYTVTYGGIKNNIIANMDDASISIRTAITGQDIDLDYNAHVDCQPAVYTGSSWSNQNEATWEATLAGTGWSTAGETHSIFTLANVAACLLNNAADQPTGDHNNYNFGLRSTSPLYAAGGHLTQIAGAVTSSTTFVVDNSHYFFDGYGRTDIAGDTIYIEGVGSRVISDVNTNTHTITVTVAFSAADNAKVWFGSSATPNIGADAFRESSSPASSGTSTGSGEFLTHRFAHVNSATDAVALPTTMGTAANAGLFITSYATADDTAVDHAQLGIGVWAGSSNLAAAIGAEHNVASTDTYRRLETDGSILVMNPQTGAILVKGTVTSTTTTTLNLAYATHSATAFLISAALFAAQQSYAAEVAIPQTNGASVTVTPNFRPDVVLLVTIGKTSGSDYANARISIGLATYDGTTLTQGCNIIHWQDAQGTPPAAARGITTVIGGEVDTAGGLSRSIVMSAPGTTSFTLTTGVANWSDADVKAFVLCLKFDGLSSNLQWLTTPSSTNSSYPYTVGLQAGFGLLVGTMLTATDTSTADAKAGAMGVGVSDMTRQYSVAVATEKKSSAGNSNTESNTDDRIMQLHQHDGTAGDTAALAATPTTTTALQLNHSATVAAHKWLALTIARPATGISINLGVADAVASVIDPRIPVQAGTVTATATVVDPSVRIGGAVTLGTVTATATVVDPSVRIHGPGLITLTALRRAAMLHTTKDTENMASEREVLESPVEQGSAETKLWPITIDDSWGTVQSVTAVTLHQVAYDGSETDVSNTKLSGTASTSGQIIFPPLVTGLTEDANYILRVRFTTINSQTEEVVCRIVCRG